MNLKAKSELFLKMATFRKESQTLPVSVENDLAKSRGEQNVSLSRNEEVRGWFGGMARNLEIASGIAQSSGIVAWLPMAGDAKQLADALRAPFAVAGVVPNAQLAGNLLQLVGRVKAFASKWVRSLRNHSNVSNAPEARMADAIEAAAALASETTGPHQMVMRYTAEGQANKQPQQAAPAAAPVDEDKLTAGAVQAIRAHLKALDGLWSIEDRPLTPAQQNAVNAIRSIMTSLEARYNRLHAKMPKDRDQSFAYYQKHLQAIDDVRSLPMVQQVMRSRKNEANLMSAIEEQNKKDQLMTAMENAVNEGTGLANQQ